MKGHGGLRLAWLMILLVAALPAAKVEFTAGVHAQRIGMDDTLQLTVTLRGLENPSPPDLAGLEDFQVRSRSISTSIQSMNGRTSLQTSFEYRLVPLRTGMLTIPALEYEVDGRTLKTAPIRVEVVKGSVAPPPERRSLFDDDLFPFRRNRQRAPVDLKLEAGVSPRRVVPGQQVMLTVRLLTRNTVRAVNMMTEPAIPGFWQEWFPIPRSIAGKTLDLEGKTYTEYEIRRVALFPNQSGTLTVPALKFEIVLADEGLGFFMEPRRLTRATSPLSVMVQPLPAEAAGLPVGHFTMKVEPLPKQIKIHDMAALKLRISGNGNMKTLAVPGLESGPFFQVFPPKVEREFEHSGATLRGTVRAEIPVTFRRAGAVSLPPLELRWWDPVSQQIRATTSVPMTVMVEDTPGRNGITAAPAGAEVVRRGRDIHHIRGGRIYDQSRRWLGSGTFTWLLVLPFLISLAALAYRTVWEPMFRRNRRVNARRVLSRTIKELRGLGELGGAAGTLDRYLTQRLGLAPSRINAATIAGSLGAHGISEREIREFLEIKEKIDNARYAPGTASARSREDLERLGRLLRSMDRRIK